jgi:hypothetical protein
VRKRLDRDALLSILADGDPQVCSEVCDGAHASHAACAQ